MTTFRSFLDCKVDLAKHGFVTARPVRSHVNISCIKKFRTIYKMYRTKSIYPMNYQCVYSCTINFKNCTINSVLGSIRCPRFVFHAQTAPAHAAWTCWQYIKSNIIQQPIFCIMSSSNNNTINNNIIKNDFGQPIWKLQAHQKYVTWISLNDTTQHRMFARRLACTIKHRYIFTNSGNANQAHLTLSHP